MSTDLTTTENPRCGCISTRLVFQGLVTGAGRPICSTHEADTIRVAEAQREQNRRDTELARIRLAHADGLAAATATQTGSAPVALNDDDALVAVIAGAVGAPVTRNAVAE
jgi:hypothetical protein